MAIVTPLNIGSIAGLDVAAPPLMAFQIPVTDGLIAAHFLGHGAGAALLNLAPGASSTPATFLGDPAVGDGFIEMDINTALQTDVDETLAMTLIATGRRKTTSTAVGFIGNNGGGSAYGASIYASVNYNDAQSIVGRDGTTGGAMRPNGNIDTWTTMSLVVPSTGPATLYDHTASTSVVDAGTPGRALTGAGKIRIGSMRSASFAAATQMNLGMIYTRALTTAENLLMGEFAMDYASQCGLI